MNYTYIVQCADGTLYTGWTNCLARRMKAHNEGKAGAKYTRAKRPVKLVYYEGFATKEEAMSREYRDQAADQGEEAGVDEVLNCRKSFSIPDADPSLELKAVMLNINKSSSIRAKKFCTIPISELIALFVYTAGGQLQRRQKKTLYDNKNQIFGIV